MQKKRERMGSLSHRCCSKQKVKRGLWSPEEDEKLLNYITIHGGQHGSWSCVPKLAGLERCGKSCRLRWTNYLRPEVKRGSFSAEEEEIIIDVHRILGNRWAQIAKHLPGRTDNEVKNFWNSCIKKKLIAQGLDPATHNLISSSNLHHHHHLLSQPPQPNPPQNPYTNTNNYDLSSISSSSSMNNVVDMQFGVLNNHMSVWGSSTPAVSSPLPLVQAPTSALLYDHDQVLHQQEQQHYYYDHDMTMLSNTCSFGDQQLMDSIISASGMHEHDLTTSISMDDLISCNYQCNF